MQEQELIRTISELAPMIEAHATEAERQRKPVDAVMAAIEATQVYRYFVPKKYGGFEFSLEGFMEIGMALGTADISTAWVVTFCIEHNWLVGLYDEQAQADIFGKNPYIIAPGTLAPRGKASPVEGGYMVSGHWEWGTGVMHANYVMVAAMTEHAGPPEFCMYILPRAEAEVLDTWQMSGMVATGSNDIVINNRFVPAHLRVNLADIRAGDSPGARLHETPVFRMPMLPVLGLTAASPAVGCARKVVDLFAERVRERTVYGSTSRQSDNALAQSRLGHLKARITTLEGTLKQTARDTMAWGESGQICPETERAHLRVRIGHIVREARNIVRDVIEASGAHAHNLSSPLQRALRDLETLSCHTVFDLDIATESYGRLLLGLPASSPV
ncbi:MAG: hypothetical protein KDI36_11675 [Pseudomonadales bacterium]|nr:hypothetical protein [Pseudomonadales bacterium]